jgi:hypothetical protein
MSKYVDIPDTDVSVIDCTDKAFRFGLAWFMVFNATFNNISVIS